MSCCELEGVNQITFLYLLLVQVIVILFCSRGFFLLSEVYDSSVIKYVFKMSCLSLYPGSPFQMCLLMMCLTQRLLPFLRFLSLHLILIQMENGHLFKGTFSDSTVQSNLPLSINVLYASAIWSLTKNFSIKHGHC